ncbi:MAG TPA: peptidylprolyl isomerase [bacterium]|nr:peptidylprolyl isomerase [bacterium]
MKLKLILSAALAAGVLSASAVTQPAVTPVATNASPEATMKALFGDPTIVKGKGFEIKQSELDQVLTGAKANAAAQGQQLPPEFQAAILNQLITIQALLQKATPADRAAGQAEADLQYTNLVKRFGSPEAFDRQLKAVGMTVGELRAKAVQEATAKAALKRELHITVTDDQAKAFYAKHSADFEQPELAHVRHILLMTLDPTTREPLATNAVTAKRKQIDDLLKQVRSGGDFAALAGKYSEDPGSKEKGGELPEFSRGQMVPEFESAAFALTNNQVSDVVTTMYGFHIIKMIDKTPAKKFAYTDTLPQINKSVADICKGEVEAENIKLLAPDYVKKLRTDMDVQITDPSLKALDETVRAAAEAADTNAAPVLPLK